MIHHRFAADSNHQIAQQRNPDLHLGQRGKGHTLLVGIQQEVDSRPFAQPVFQGHHRQQVILLPEKFDCPSG